MQVSMFKIFLSGDKNSDKPLEITFYNCAFVSRYNYISHSQIQLSPTQLLRTYNWVISYWLSYRVKVTVTGPMQNHLTNDNKMYSKTCVKQPLSKIPNMFFNTSYRLMQVKIGVFCNTFDLH